MGTREEDRIPPGHGEYVPLGTAWGREQQEAQADDRRQRRERAAVADASDAAILDAAFPGAGVQLRDRVWSATAPGGEPLVSTGPGGLGWQLIQAHHRPEDPEAEARLLADLRAFFGRWSVAVCDGTWEAIPSEHGNEARRITAPSAGELALKLIREEMQAHLRRAITA